LVTNVNPIIKGGGNAMKRNFTVIGIIGLVICLSMLVMAGCAKKQAVKDQPVAGETKAVAQAEKEVVKQEPAKKDDTAEAAAREAAAREAAAKEAIAKEAASFKDINFDFDEFSLRSDAREILKKHAEWLAKYGNYGVLIEGNCDERGTTEYNMALGERRAKEAMKYLVELGLDAKRIKTISYGKEKPLDPEHNEEAWAKNRRDHFVVTPK
jgi:peptidoglycan-associated lipoprotein